MSSWPREEGEDGSSIRRHPSPKRAFYLRGKPSHTQAVISPTTLFGEDAAILGDRSFQLLLLANLSPPLGNALISPLLETLVGPYGVSEAEIGLLLTAFTAPNIVLLPLVGVLANRVGRKSVSRADCSVSEPAGSGWRSRPTSGSPWRCDCSRGSGSPG